MYLVRIVAIVLIVAGTGGLVYERLSYTKQTHEATVGSVQLSVKEKEDVTIPAWAGVGAIAAGTLLLLLGKWKN